MTRQNRQTLLRNEIALVSTSSHGTLRVALCYPNDYFVGMSNLGFHAVYRLLAAIPEVRCERVFLPDGNGSDARPRSLETDSELRRFDVIAFSMSFESDALLLARMLHDSGLRLFASERGPRDPLIAVGGAAAFLNPEPFAPFVDVVTVGEGEALVPRLIEIILGSSAPKAALDSLRREDGFYVPARYAVHLDDDGRIISVDGPGPVIRQRSSSVAAPPESAFLTPYTELSMKYLVEIVRGCPCLCRFCWAGYSYLPARQFPRPAIVERAQSVRPHTNKIGLVATAVCHHAEIEDLVNDLAAMGYEIAVSSLRFDDLTADLVVRLSETGTRGLTLAPESGSDRLRRSLNKPFTNAEILDRAAWIFENRIDNLKLYYMIGLPDERMEDIEAIITLTDEIRARMLEIARERGRIGRIEVSINPFIPKPGTPFQWQPLADPIEIERRTNRLRRAFARMPNVRAQLGGTRSLTTHAALSLGDRRVADAIEASITRGVSLARALRSTGIDLRNILIRGRAREEIMPWNVIDNGVDTEFLWRESQAARAGRSTPRCPVSESCARCGVCLKAPP